jgi:hypothetical protein
VPVVRIHARSPQTLGFMAIMIGRHAQLTAAMGVVAARNADLAVPVTLGPGGIKGITWSDSLLRGAALTVVGAAYFVYRRGSGSLRVP